MANSGLDIIPMERCDSLSNLINQRARDRARAPISVYSNLCANLQRTPSRMTSLENRTSKAVEDGYLYTQIGGESGRQKWPVPRSKSLQGLRALAESQQCSETSQSISFSAQRHLLPRANLAPKKEVVTHKRRKASLPDLALVHMTTVQEGMLDSPTLPGHHPILRSMSFPDTQLRQVPEETSDETPRGSLFSCSHLEESPKAETWAECMEKTVRRSSSMIVLQNFEPLVTPTPTEAKEEENFQPYRIKSSDEECDKPPKVPPKSPRTQSRATRRPKKLSHSATSSTSTAGSISSAETSVSSKSMYTSLSGEYGSTSIEKFHAEPLTSLDQGSRHTPPHDENSRSRPRNPQNGEQDVSIIPQAAIKLENAPGDQEFREPKGEKKVAKHMGGVLDSIWHQKEASEPSVIDRGRPMRRGDTSLMCNLSKMTPKRPPLEEKDSGIPTGVRAREASNSLPGADLKILKQLANERVESFEVLSMENVSKLSKELVLLDERCQYLRHTYASLRQGRKGLRERVISYLKSPRISKQTCGSILKQEEVLAELDLSIDDWVLKLEHAENRRTQIRQKLLEHVAAALTLQTTHAAENSRPQQQHVSKVETPPTTPEQIVDDYCQEPCGIQSISVYADTGVADLLSAIEDEIGLMDDGSAMAS